MASDSDRRSFVGSAAATAAFTLVPRHVLGGAGYVAPSDKITLAHIGMGTQSFAELSGLLASPEIQIVAVCDPNRSTNDYVEWGKGSIRNTIRRILSRPDWQPDGIGCPGGREIGREVIDAYYANQRGVDKFRSVNAYADFRELLDKEKDINAVKVMTPDHLHATVSVAAMKRGLGVVMHKPLANRMHEARIVIETARKTKVPTHFLPYGAGEGNRRICQRIKEGAIGTLREVHNWSNRPVWPQYTQIPEGCPIPPGFDWDLWLGPSLDRPYSPHYTHAVFRGWYEFGGGSMADMGIYSLWPVFTELNLGAPLSADAWATHTNTIEEQVSKRVRNDFAYPAACTIHFKFPARGAMPPLDLFWYDGGIKPRLPDELETANVEWPIEGILFVGDQGKIFAGFNGQTPQLAAKGRIEPLFPGETQQPRRQGGGPDRSAIWLPAFKGGEPSPGNFLNAGGISDAVTLGTVSLRAGRKVLFDSENMKITNIPEANKYLVREYRKGWEL
jgi:hypothetical protein